MIAITTSNSTSVKATPGGFRLHGGLCLDRRLLLRIAHLQIQRDVKYKMDKKAQFRSWILVEGQMQSQEKSSFLDSERHGTTVWFSLISKMQLLAEPTDAPSRVV
jgi:hypothetical protein